MNLSDKQIEAMKQKYPPGTRIELESMEDEFGMPQGLKGTVEGVDDIGNIMMKWDNKRSLSLIPAADKFSVITRKLEPEGGGIGMGM